MTQTREVVRVFGLKYEVYTVEYFDSQSREWLNAVGEWEGYQIKGFYESQDAALLVADHLNKISGKITRTLKDAEVK